MKNHPSPTRNKSSAGHKGVALIYVIAVAGIVSMIIGVMMSQYIMSRYSIRSSFEKTQAFYIAEAGVKKAFSIMATDPTKGINWRTGNLLQDKPVEEKVFYERDETAEISVVDDCGFLRIRSHAKGKYPNQLEVFAAGTVPESLKNNLYIVSQKPLILGSGSKLKGLIKLNMDLSPRGGSIEGIKEINPALQLPIVYNASFVASIAYLRYLLSTPDKFGDELFGPQNFSPRKPVPAQEIFVNDLVLIENTNLDSTWFAGTNLTIASTAEIQISGATKMTNLTAIAVGPIKILDNADVGTSRIYSETRIEIRKDARFSGVLMAPEIMIGEQVQITNPSILYSGIPFKYGKISFKNESTLYCTVLNLGMDNTSLIEISDNTKIEGVIYSNAPISHKGEISGYVYCRAFYDEPMLPDSNTNIISGTIKPTDSQVSPPIPIIFPGIRNFKIIQWQEF